MEIAVICSCGKYKAKTGCALCWLCAAKAAEDRADLIPLKHPRKRRNRLPPSSYKYPRPTSQPLAIKIEECRLAGISVARLMSEDRTEYVTRVRRKVATRLRTELSMAYPEIGVQLDRDHTSIMALIKSRGRVTHTARKEAEQE